MTPALTTVSREFTDTKTGQVWTLTYTRTRLGHTVDLEPPFGCVRGCRPMFTDDLRHARRMWKLLQRNLTRHYPGLVVNP